MRQFRNGKVLTTSGASDASLEELLNFERSEISAAIYGCAARI